MKTGLQVVRIVVCLLVLSTGASLYADWNQWAKNPQHTSYLPDVQGQPLTTKRWDIVIDNTVAPSGTIGIHYASPLIDADGNIYMTKKIRDEFSVIHRTLVKLDPTGTELWSYETDFVPSPAGWEAVLHPLLANGYVWVPGARSVMHLVDPASGVELFSISSFEIPDDPTIRQQLLNTVTQAGVPTVDDYGNVYYPVWARAGAPLGLKSHLAQVGPDFTVSSVTYENLTGDATQRPPVNAGAAVGVDGTVYIGSVGGFALTTGWLVAVNPDLTLKWKGSMNANPAHQARLIDQSSSCPVVGPDGRVFYGGWNSNGLSQGYLYAFSPDGDFLGDFEFGWDTTPAIYPDPDGDPAHYHLVQKFNRYGMQRYYMVSLDPNTMTIECQWELVGREWCINAPAIDMNGTVYTNGEDGYLYAISGLYPVDGQCNPSISRILLDRARDAAYTPLAVAQDGTIYTLNNGRLFAIGNPAE